MAGRGSFSDERQERIVSLVSSDGRVRISDLSTMFGVTERTIRKDLTELHQRRLLKRTHGGAIALRQVVELDLADRARHGALAKDALARASVAEIADGDAIFLGAGSTVQRIADHLAADPRTRVRNLTVLTNSLGVAQSIADQPGIDHILLGGRVRRTSGCVVGTLTIEELLRFTVNVAFIGVSAISKGGISVAHLDEAQVAAAAIDRARRVVVPVIHEKIGSTHFATICELDDLDTIVADHVDEPLSALCAEHGLRLVDAGVPRAIHPDEAASA
jgi:DeoR/GlpR family transcriptional regulator of sugar metabolism